MHNEVALRDFKPTTRENAILSYIISIHRTYLILLLTD